MRVDDVAGNLCAVPSTGRIHSTPFPPSPPTSASVSRRSAPARPSRSWAMKAGAGAGAAAAASQSPVGTAARHVIKRILSPRFLS
jgi:hypothetical protein